MHYKVYVYLVKNEEILFKGVSLKACYRMCINIWYSQEKNGKNTNSQLIERQKLK